MRINISEPPEFERINPMSGVKPQKGNCTQALSSVLLNQLNFGVHVTKYWLKGSFKSISNWCFIIPSSIFFNYNFDVPQQPSSSSKIVRKLSAQQRRRPLIIKPIISSFLSWSQYGVKGKLFWTRPEVINVPTMAH